MLWVAGPTAHDPDAAMKLIEAYREQGKQVVVDERHLLVARNTESALLARGGAEVALGLEYLLAYAKEPAIDSVTP